MCKFCETQKGLINKSESRVLNMANVNNGKWAVFTEVFGDNIFMMLDDGENISTINGIEINYCPMCGRKLRK